MLAKITRDARPTTTRKSEKDLAIAMGYPKNWRVIRKLITIHKTLESSSSNAQDIEEVVVQPVITSSEEKQQQQQQETDAKNDENKKEEQGKTTTTAAVSNNDNDNVDEMKKSPQKATTTTTTTMTLLQDRIYAGNPKKNVDMYFNHDAARKAVLKLYYNVNFNSTLSLKTISKPTPYSDKGGQLLSRFAIYKKNDLVEVYYEPDDEWYHAYIVKKTEYDDDIRYTVHYIVEDSTQTNVSEEDVRYATSDPPKPKSKTTKTKKLTKKQQQQQQKATEAAKKKRGRPRKNIDYVEEAVEEEDDDDDDDDDEEEEDEDDGGHGGRPRRKRGRPRGSSSTGGTNKKRYRPRSSTSKRIKYKEPGEDDLDGVEQEPTVAVNKKKRGRGRPPSSSSSSRKAKSSTATNLNNTMKREHQEETEQLFDDDDDDDELALADDVAYASALSLGLPPGWKATNNGDEDGDDWYIRGPNNGEEFYSQKKAQEYVIKNNLSGGTSGSATANVAASTAAVAGGSNNKEDIDADDPPWRTDNHVHLNKRVRYTHKQKYSATRIIDIEQYGTIVGWISKDDVDKNGNPGFVSEHTGQPSNLFHVMFDPNPNHPYVNHLLSSKDFEESELEDFFHNDNDEKNDKKNDKQQEEEEVKMEKPKDDVGGEAAAGEEE